MKPFYVLPLFPGWITYVFNIPWLAIVGGVMLLFILLEGLFLFFFKRKIKPEKSSGSVQKEKRNVNYDEISETITRQNGRLRSLLFAATNVRDLPVTVPVNVAIRLAQTHTCLLIDLDIKRNAMAHVFDLDAVETNGALNISSRSTAFKNLSVWPARNFVLLKQTNLRSLLDGALKKYHYVLIYAPYLTTLPDRRQVAACAKQAIAFTGNNDSSLMQLLEQCNCKVVQEL